MGIPGSPCMARSRSRGETGPCGWSSGAWLEAEADADRGAPEVEVAEIEVARVDDHAVRARLALQAAEVAEVAAQPDVVVEVPLEAAADVDGEVVAGDVVEEVAR